VKKTIYTIYFFSILILVQSCGYHNPYTLAHPEVTDEVIIYMSAWTNRTNELGLEAMIFQKTADWLEEIPYLQLTAAPEKADYQLSGRVESVSYPATAFSTSDRATTLSARVKTTFKLTDASGKTVWQVENMTREATYPTGDSGVISQSNKKAALQKIGDEIGEQVYLRIMQTLTRQNTDN